MALFPLKIGVPQVFLSIPNAAVSLTGFAGVVPQVCAIAPLDQLDNDVRSQVSLNTNYQFMVAPVGYSTSLRGYSVGQASQGSGIIQATTLLPAFRIYIPSQTTVGGATSLPANYNQAICLAIFVKKGSASLWQLCQLSYIDPTNDFNDIVCTDPIAAASTFTQALLQSVTVDPFVLGDRIPVGVTWQAITLTEGGVEMDYDVETVQVAPDNGPNWKVRTSTACNVKFGSLINSPRELVRSTGGEINQFSADAGSTIQIAHKTLLTAQAILRGCAAMYFTMPVDSNGVAETLLLLGNLGITQTMIKQAWKKNAVTLTQFDLQTATQDTLVLNQYSEVHYKRAAFSFVP